jgi:magnesium chelatase subunit D
MSGANVQGSGFVVQSSEFGATNSEPGIPNSEPISYPFAAVAGHEAAKHALLLLAIEPELRGVLIASESGSAKSVLARSFASTRSGVPPWAPLLRASKRDGTMRVASGGKPLHGRIDAQMIELPLGVTEDRLLGGLDLERTLGTGKREVSRGLLAQADGQVLYVDSINLLDSDIAIYLAHAIESRQVFVERESVSATHASDFALVATYNPAEGEPSSLLRDRVGLIVEASGEASPDIRAEIIERDLRFENDPAGFAEDFAFETAQIKQNIEAGRTRLPGVLVSKERRRQIAQIAMRLGVEGNRADLFALKAARANAALAGRDSIEDEDVVIAIQLVLAPRASTLLAEDAATRPGPSLHESEQQNKNQDRADSSSAGIEDVVIAAIDSRAPKDLLVVEQTRSRSSRSGKRLKGSPSNRGRYVSSEPRPHRDARVAIDATLRAAAPFQLRRMVADSRAAMPEMGDEARSGTRGAHRVKIQPSDLRYKKFKHRSGIMFIFAVDASGSMALNRMAQAKGALTRLLGEAYLHRDKVALISFRGDGSQVLLAPTRSVELAKRIVDAMPAGGGTPISAGVLKAIELARRSRLQGMSQAMLVLFTDGRANVRLGHERAIEDELRQLGALLRAEGIASVIVDTKARFLSNGEGRALAEMLGSRYLFLPRLDPTSVQGAIASITGRPRERQWLRQ